MNDFNLEGVTAVKTALYDLVDDQLLDEAKLMAINFRAWLNGKFNFTQEQTEYLDQIPEKVLFIWGAKLGAVMADRDDVEFEFGPKPTYRTKQTDLDAVGNARYIPGQAPQINGSAKIRFIQP